MSLLRSVALKARNFKCFGDQPEGFEKILPVNLIIGRNNSGKSALIDLVEFAVTPTDLSPFGHNGRMPEVQLTTSLVKEDLQGVFSESRSGGDIPGNHWQFGKQWVDRPLTWTLPWKGNAGFVSTDPQPETKHRSYFIRVAERKPLPESESRTRPLPSSPK